MIANQVAGFTLTKSTTLNLSLEEAILNAQRTSSFLVNMLVMMDPQQIKTNETIKDAYQECILLKEYLSEQLWSVVEDEGIHSVQATMDEINQALSKYEMTKDMVEGDWEFVDVCVPSC